MGAGDSKEESLKLPTKKSQLSIGKKSSHSESSRFRTLKNVQNPWTYFELCVSPGFDAEIPRGMPQKECQDEGLVSRYFLNGAHFIGVFDGHGKEGKKAARYVAHQLPMQIMASQPCSPNLQHAFINACRRVDASLLSTECGFDCTMSGTTACFALLKGKELLLGNVGDSKAIVARQGPGGPQDIQGVPLTEEHKPNTPAEMERIVQSGGRVQQMIFEGTSDGPYRVYLKERRTPGLAMSRHWREEAQRRWMAMDAEAPVVDDTTILLVRFHASQEALAARY
ncbi:hypothetical protein CYMTET_51022 [Cymbomonas tetramitiformis]|uniref:protein-serine/threonine phosphatase n=1 Tax=Cymbomonas tetramitiformis TaxID=36881 RepID=A0AAE0ESK7_9CHLO|nr:hypothetical protein CYMTET_51022 [Cymbomonas tetramitiformis]